MPAEVMVSSADILNAKILVVDDKEANVRLLEGMLRVAGYTSVDSTTDPNEVCELHRKNRYGLILLDLQMPGMDGFQVMEGLKEIEDGRLSSGPRDHRAAGPQAARARSRRQGFRQQTVRSGRAAGARPQHSGSAPAAPRSEELQQSAGGDGAGTGSQPRGHSSEDPGGAKEERAGIGLGAGDSGKPAPPFPAPVREFSASMLSTIPRAMWEGISTISCN